jgi:hypothetical protein
MAKQTFRRAFASGVLDFVFRTFEFVSDFGFRILGFLQLRPRAALRCDRRATGCATAQHARGTQQLPLRRHEYTSAVMPS